MLFFDSLSLDDTKWWLGASEWLLLYATLALIIGLAGEWADIESWKKTRSYKFAKLLVIVGVIGEFFGDAGIFETTSRIQSLDDAKISSLELKLISRASLLTDHEAAFVQKVKQFPARFEIGLDLGNSEQSALAEKLVSVLVDKCGWTHVKWDGGATVGNWQVGAASGPPPLGAGWAIAKNVEIHVSDDDRPSLDHAVKALASALTDDAKIDAADAGSKNVVSINKHVIHIWIGDKQYPAFLGK